MISIPPLLRNSIDPCIPWSLVNINIAQVNNTLIIYKKLKIYLFFIHFKFKIQLATIKLHITYSTIVLTIVIQEKSCIKLLHD